MQTYDTVLKSLLSGSPNSIVEQIAGVKVERWLNIELPVVQNLRMDLLAESVDGELFQCEVQTRNAMDAPVRMAEYSLRTFRVLGRFPKQFLIYVGAEPMRMPSALVGPDHICRYTLVDIRELDSEPLLESPHIADNVLAVLTRIKDQKQTVRRILTRIAELSGDERATAFQQFLILSGLRKLEMEVREEVAHMPIFEEILEHQVIGPALKQGMEEGRHLGLEEGRHQGAIAVVRRQIERRFGPIAPSAAERLALMTEPELDDLLTRLPDAGSINELLGR